MRNKHWKTAKNNKHGGGKIKANGRVIDLSEHTWAIEALKKRYGSKGQLMKKQSAKQRVHRVAKSSGTFDDNPLEFKEEGSPANR